MSTILPLGALVLPTLFAALLWFGWGSPGLCWPYSAPR